MKQQASIVCALAVALGLMVGTAQAVDNVGTGGTITYTDAGGTIVGAPVAGGDVIHTFTNSGTLNIPIASSADVLVVAGGGAGGTTIAGGGGGGGLLYTNVFSITASSNYSVVVGAGGVNTNAAGVSGWIEGGSGSNSQFGTALIAYGGGGGAGWLSGNGHAGIQGGSGGGGAQGGGGGANSPSGQGYPGRASVGNGAGGGGGASSQGSIPTTAQSGTGGAGLPYGISGLSTYYAGGGGGGAGNGAALGAGGLGGGGAGGPTTGVGINGTNSLGGGGGGGGFNGNGYNGGSGGSGIVIVRYPYDVGSLYVEVTAPANGRQFLPGSSITATVSVASGTMPYTVTFYTNSAVAWSTNNASTNLFTIDLGALADGTYTNYATVTDNVSSNATSATNMFTVAPDATAPTPDPMTFAVNPKARDATSIIMTATTATDALSPPVEYYFENVTNSSNSGWILGTAWTNSGLTEGVSYGYKVKARDSATTPNETAFSSVFAAIPVPLNIFWDSNTTGGGQTDGGGTWLNANQWWTGTANTTWDNGLPNNATIGNGGNGGTITLGTVTAGTVTLGGFTGTYTLSGGSLTQSGGLTVNSGNVTIDSLISGAGGISKAGAGTMIITSFDNTGKTLVTGGILQLGTGHPNTWGGQASNLEINGGTVSVFYYATRSLGAGAGQIQLTGGRGGFSNKQGDAAAPIWTVNNSAAYEVVWGALGEGAATGYFNPSIFVLNDGAASPAQHVYFPNKLDLNGTNRTIECSSAAWGGILTGVIRNSGGTAAGLIKTGVGKLDLSAVNTYDGETTVNAGTLQINVVNAIPTNSTVTIATNAMLNLNFATTNTVKRLVIGTMYMNIGLYGHANSGADNGGLGVGSLNTYFGTGVGKLNVLMGPPPPRGTLIILR